MSVELTLESDLKNAVAAVSTALTALRHDPRSTAVRHALDRATDAVSALEPDLTAEVLKRLVASIADCHREGVTHSRRLAVCHRSTRVALRLDPRWA
ncbi:hypothetical protein [Pseudonocardia spinosispora]|uniref:hypothetical protein n=1 Tax=Pseudonocardia spinosispora TaxID=103441 RepID=UPI000411D513|nr:hypothetical protein [Pseudonocardia spinosispora]